MRGMESEEAYSTAEAAKILRLTTRRVTQMLERGELEGAKDGRGRWRVSQRAVHALLPDRPARDTPRDAPPEPRESHQEAAELRSRLEDLQRELGRLEGRLELTEVAESTMRQERERLIADLERERERAERLERELAESRRPWWQRMFGG
jgi:excisionase family DNA binding protein